MRRGAAFLTGALALAAVMPATAAARVVRVDDGERTAPIEPLVCFPEHGCPRPRAPELDVVMRPARDGRIRLRLDRAAEGVRIRVVRRGDPRSYLRTVRQSPRRFTVRASRWTPHRRMSLLATITYADGASGDFGLRARFAG